MTFSNKKNSSIVLTNSLTKFISKMVWFSAHRIRLQQTCENVILFSLPLLNQCQVKIPDFSVWHKKVRVFPHRLLFSVFTASHKMRFEK